LKNRNLFVRKGACGSSQETFWSIVAVVDNEKACIIHEIHLAHLPGELLRCASKKQTTHAIIVTHLHEFDQPLLPAEEVHFGFRGQKLMQFWHHV